MEIEIKPKRFNAINDSIHPRDQRLDLQKSFKFTKLAAIFDLFRSRYLSFDYLQA